MHSWTGWTFRALVGLACIVVTTSRASALTNNGVFTINGGQSNWGDTVLINTGVININGGQWIGGNIIEASPGILNVGPATVQWHSLIVGDAVATGPTYFNITNAGAAIQISQSLQLGKAAVFTAVPGSVIHMAGSNWVNYSNNPAAVAGLENTTFLFEGGLSRLSTFEVAGRDIGGNEPATGWVDDFHLADLRLGGVDVGRLQLVNLLDNTPNWAGREALYVDVLELGRGSFLDLNGIDLYYRTALISPEATIELHGGSLAAAGIPEPVTLATGALAVLALGLGWVTPRRVRGLGFSHPTGR